MLNILSNVLVHFTSAIQFMNAVEISKGCICFRDIFLEKHWRSVLGRSVCDYFFEAQGKVRKRIN